MPRTTSAAVVDILGGNYSKLPNGSSPSLSAYIATASAVVDEVVVQASRKGITLADSLLELIERWLSAHYYTKMDPVYQSRSTKGASASFVRDGKDAEPYRNAAIDLDTSNTLDAILNRNVASSVWLGKAPSEQIAYEDRN